MVQLRMETLTWIAWTILNQTRLYRIVDIREQNTQGSVFVLISHQCQEHLLTTVSYYCHTVIERVKNLKGFNWNTFFDEISIITNIFKLSPVILKRLEKLFWKFRVVDLGCFHSPLGTSAQGLNQFSLIHTGVSCWMPFPPKPCIYQGCGGIREIKPRTPFVAT